MDDTTFATLWLVIGTGVLLVAVTTLAVRDRRTARRHHEQHQAQRDARARARR